MKLEGGYDSVEERDFFQWRNAEYARVRDDVFISDEEKNDRLKELGELSIISTPKRRADVVPYVRENYSKRLNLGKNYYSQRPLHWTSSTVK